MKYPIYGQAPGVSIRDTESDNLHICWSEEDGFMILFTPDMQNTNNHYHVELNHDQATMLRDFLSEHIR